MQPLQQLLVTHSKLISSGISVWVLLSLVVNLLLLIKGPKEWVDTAKKNPKTALVINVLFRAFGIDLVSVVLHLRDYVSARAVDSKNDSNAANTAAPQSSEGDKS